ncbi:hypothetical protein NDU88_003073 [Pleurodeles waltl]|uniref:Uncharacterized protein n=1 Tax=Pleurodeles waltl TaxID=8319 RepID=A0AAV7MPR8_PLEWA|nr:hypothetical protein NDU88_003073 [Pleurodeles waltl]
MTGPDLSDTQEDSDSCSESDGSQFAADCTCDPRSEPVRSHPPRLFRYSWGEPSSRSGSQPEFGVSCALVHTAPRHQGESPQYGDFCAASLSRPSSPLLTISFAFLAPAPLRRTKESGRTGKGPSDPPRLSQAVVAKGRLSLEPQERSRRYRPLSSPTRFSLRARDAALRMPRGPYLVSAAILDLSVRRYESPKVSPSAPFVL